jgi:putative oxidoreductase
MGKSRFACEVSATDAQKTAAVRGRWRRSPATTAAHEGTGQNPGMPKSGDAVTDIAARPQRSMIAAFAVIPYALVALGLRLVMARVFFLSGQAKIEGPIFPVHIGGLDVAVILPAGIKDTTYDMFASQYAGLPIAPSVAATLFTYAEFVLPICLALGFATRFAAFGLLVMTVLLQVYVAPGMWWPAHVYWAAILLVLITVGPGAISIDALIRAVYRWERAKPLG